MGDGPLADADANIDAVDPAARLECPWHKRYRQLQQARIMLVHLGIAAEQIYKARLECEALFESAGQDGSNTIEEYDECLHSVSMMIRVWEAFIQIVGDEMRELANQASRVS